MSNRDADCNLTSLEWLRCTRRCQVAPPRSPRSPPQKASFRHRPPIFDTQALNMGSTASKPVKSAAGAASRRQYPKKPAPPPKPPVAPKQFDKPEPSHAPPSKPESTPSPAHFQVPGSSSQGPTYHSKEQASSVKSNGMNASGLFLGRFATGNTQPQRNSHTPRGALLKLHLLTYFIISNRY